MEGTYDGDFSNATVAALYELESLRRRIWRPEFPAYDLEGRKRLRSVASYITPYYNYDGAGQPPEGVQTMIYCYPILITYDWQEEDLLYQVTKAIGEYFPLYKAVSPAMANWEQQKAKMYPKLPCPIIRVS